MSSVTIVRKTRGVAVSHTFFEYPPSDSVADIERAIQVSEPRADGGWKCTEFHTLLLDLGREQSDLWQGVRSRIRRYIQALEKEPVETVFVERPAESDIQDYMRFHAVAARARSLPSADAAFLRALADQGALVLSVVRLGPDRDLARRAHVISSGRARQVFSATVPIPEGGALGHANHFLQWKEVLFFKALGVPRYDFGGVSLAPEGTRLAGIDAFKRNFGGTEVREFKCRRAVTTRGRVALAAETAIASVRRARAAFARPQPAPAEKPQPAAAEKG